jgi:hypothetical protein
MTTKKAKPTKTESLIKMLNVDKIINDLLDILSTLDGRVKRLELKAQVKKSPSYLKLVDTNKNDTDVSEDIREDQILHCLELIQNAVVKLTNKIDRLEEQHEASI